MDVQLSFSKSRSAMYGKVINLCRAFNNFTQEDGINVVRAEIKEIVERWEAFNGIFGTACSWSSFSLHLNDQPIIGNTEIKKVYYSLQDLKNCLKDFHKEFDKDLHCEGGQFWGCHKLKSVEVLPSWYTIDKGWYMTGSLEDGNWKINKQQILNKLLTEAKEKLVKNCPNFKEDRIRAVVSALPDQLDIATKNWRLTTSLKFIDGQFKTVCTGIQWHGTFAEYKPETFLQPTI